MISGIERNEASFWEDMGSFWAEKSIRDFKEMRIPEDVVELSAAKKAWFNFDPDEPGYQVLTYAIGKAELYDIGDVEPLEDYVDRLLVFADEVGASKNLEAERAMAETMDGDGGEHWSHLVDNYCEDELYDLPWDTFQGPESLREMGTALHYWTFVAVQDSEKEAMLANLILANRSLLRAYLNNQGF